MYRTIIGIWFCLGVTLSGCGGSSTGSGGPSPFAGAYEGTMSVAGVGSRDLTVHIALNGEIAFDVWGGGIVCNGDVPNDLALDGDSFDGSDSGECLVGGFPCPTTTIITGAVSGGAITGSGQVLVGCPTSTRSYDFGFVAREQ